METIFEILKWFLVLIGGATGTWLATEAIKRADFIAFIKDGDKIRLRALAGIFSALAVVLIGFVDGNLAPENLQELLIKITELLVIWLGAHTVHKTLK